MRQGFTGRTRIRLVTHLFKTLPVLQLEEAYTQVVDNIPFTPPSRVQKYRWVTASPQDLVDMHELFPDFSLIKDYK